MDKADLHIPKGRTQIHYCLERLFTGYIQVDFKRLRTTAWFYFYSRYHSNITYSISYQQLRHMNVMASKLPTDRLFVERLVQTIKREKLRTTVALCGNPSLIDSSYKSTLSGVAVQWRSWCPHHDSMTWDNAEWQGLSGMRGIQYELIFSSFAFIKCNTIIGRESRSSLIYCKIIQISKRIIPWMWGIRQEWSHGGT